MGSLFNIKLLSGETLNFEKYMAALLVAFTLIRHFRNLAK